MPIANRKLIVAALAALAFATAAQRADVIAQAAPSKLTTVLADLSRSVPQEPGSAVPRRVGPAAALSLDALPSSVQDAMRGRLLRINEILDEKVRPYLMGDGGYLEILDLTDHTLKIRYQGACGSCPSSLTGTLMAIEGMLKQEVDPDLDVVAV